MTKPVALYEYTLSIGTPTSSTIINAGQLKLDLERAQRCVRAEFVPNSSTSANAVPMQLLVCDANNSATTNITAYGRPTVPSAFRTVKVTNVRYAQPGIFAANGGVVRLNLPGSGTYPALAGVVRVWMELGNQLLS